MRREMEQMSIQIGLLKRAVSNVPAVAPDAGARLRIPESKPIVVLVTRRGREFPFRHGVVFPCCERRGRGEESVDCDNRQRVTDLGSAMAAAERLTDFNPENRKDRQTTPSPSQNKPGGARSFRSNSNRGGGDRKPHAQSSSQGSFSRNKPQENKQGAPQKSSGCFLCDGPHRYRECPKKQLLNALATFTDKASTAKPAEPRPNASGENDSEEDEDNLGAISQWCNTLSHQVAAKKMMPPRARKTAPALTESHTEEEAQPRNPRKKGLMFVD
ncbi:hypothetical protein Sango_2110100 [Sesamum angolense]|uniref:Uncharacterized protein n=1 Tax=Sesamum angolense TaxID=2727404 RepID=A0AAE2BM67_9LAMI|nr:hypothetical protein Sango_2110100 [Sesamum angolense]